MWLQHILEHATDANYLALKLSGFMRRLSVLGSWHGTIAIIITTTITITIVIIIFIAVVLIFSVVVVLIFSVQLFY